MPLSNNSVFSVVELSYSGGLLTRVFYLTTDETAADIWFDSGYPLSGTKARADLAILQTIYGSSDGFLDSNGDSLVVSVEDAGGFIHGTTDLDDIETYGYPNPFITGSYERWLNLRTWQGEFTQGRVNLRTDENDRALEHKVAFEPTEYSAEGDTYAQPLNRWRAAQWDDDSFVVFMYFDPRQEVALADADDEPEVKAFFEWISSLLDTGSAIGTAFDTSAEVETSLGGGRIYALTQTDGDTTDLKFTYATRSFTDSAQLEYYGFRFDIESDSADFDIDAVQTILSTETVDIDTTDVMVAPHVGNYPSEMRGRSIRFDDFRSVQLDGDGLVLYGKRTRGDNFFAMNLGGSYGNPQNISDGPVSNSTYRLTPDAGVNVIHFEATQAANATLFIPPPRDLLNFPNTDRTYRIHNHNTAYRLDIRLWTYNGDEVLELKPGETCQFVISRGRAGVGEVNFLEVPVRFLSHNVGSGGGVFSTLGYYTATDTRYYQPPFSAGVATRTDTDAFHTGSHILDTSGLAFDGNTVWDRANTFTITLPGEVTIRFAGTLQPTAAGNIPVGSGPVVFSQHGSDAPVERQFVPQRLISGQNQLFPFSLSYTGVFEKDTTFLVLFDIDDDFTVSAANLRFFNVEREVILRPDIDADYTP